MGCWQLGQLDTHRPCLSSSFSGCRGHNSPFQPQLREGKVRELLLCASPILPSSTRAQSISLRGCTEQRESGASTAPTQAPGAPLCRAVSLQVTHLAPQPQTRGERGQEKGAGTACFPSARPRNFFCAEQGLAHSSAERLPHRWPSRGSRRDWGSAGTGSVPPARAAPGTGHKDLKGWAVLRAVWHSAVHVQSNAGHDRSD